MQLRSSLPRILRHPPPALVLSDEARHRRCLLDRWQRARLDGLTAAQAAHAVGVSRASLFRWQRAARSTALEPRSRRPHRLRTNSWPPALVEAVCEWRNAFPAWGKAKITAILKNHGFSVSESTVGRILSHLRRSGAILPSPRPRHRRAAPRPRHHAERLPRGLRPHHPGAIVQIDTLSVFVRDAPPVRQFTACDPVAKWTFARAFPRAAAENAAAFLDQLLDFMPFPIQALQVDGGSEFKDPFEQACAERHLTLYVLPPKSPELNGHVERANGTWRSEFYACWDLDLQNLDELNSWIDAFTHEFHHLRPHQALGYRTPAQALPDFLRSSPHPRLRSTPSESHM